MAGNQLWLLTGQSNCVGAALGASPLPTADVLMPSGAGWVPAVEPLSCFDYTGCEGSAGAWVTAAHAYVYWCPGTTVKLTGWARGSMPIAAWAEGAEAWAGLKAAILRAGSGVTQFIVAVGEADATLGTLCVDYGEGLVSLIERVRALTSASLPVVIIGLADAPEQYAAGYWTIRETQRSVAALTGARFISAEGLPRSADSPFHLTVGGYHALGKRVAALFARGW